MVGTNSGGLAGARRIVERERGLATVATLRRDGTVQASVVNAGVMDHPLGGGEAVAFVAMGGSVKLTNLRRRPRATVVFRAGFAWITVEGAVTLIGPDDLPDGYDAAALPQLLRDAFLSTGATHDNFAEYDRVMAEERRCVVLVRPERVYGTG